MRTLLPAATLLALFSASFAVACGDDDDGTAATPDSGIASADASAVDSQVPPDGGGTNDSSVTSPPIVPDKTTRFANAIDPYGLLFASDGFVYVSGATIDGTTRKLAVWRFTNGALDTTFGTQGVITHDLPGDEASFDIVEVSAGSFVVHAVSGGKVYLVKLTNNAGTFTFGTEVMVPFAWADGDLTGWPSASPPAYTSWGIGLDKSVAATPKIVVFAHGAPAKVASGTQRIDNDRWIARVLADTLAPDPAFNNGSAVTFDADGKNIADNARRGTVFADGSIVSSGYANFGANLGNHIVLIRLLPTGAVDPAFGFGTTAPGTPGQTKYNPFIATGGSAEAYAVGRQSNGRYVTTGYGNSNFDVTSTNVDLIATGVTAGGVDATYGKSGAFAVQSETDPAAGLGASPFRDRGRDLIVLPDDRVVHAGVYDEYGALFVFNKNGQRDTGSGTNGVIEYAYPGNFFKIAASPDGKKIAATAQSLNQSTDAGAPVGSIFVTLKVGQ